MPTSKVIKRREKHRKSNQARLNSLALVQEQSQKSKLLIQAALNNLDACNKHHVKFSDSDDESFQSDIISSEKSKSDSILGFDNDSEKITIDPYFGKNSAQKVMQIRSNVGLDDRFKFDDRFAKESHDEDCMEEDVSNEVKKNLAVLQQVVGITSLSKFAKHKSHQFKDPSVKRYDPKVEKHLHVKSSTKTEQPVKAKKKKQDISVPNVDKQQFYQVSSTGLQQAFGKNQEISSETTTTNEEGFSLLGMFGREHDDDSNKNKMSDYKVENYDQQKKGKSSILTSQFFKDDNSESDLSDGDNLDLEDLTDKSFIYQGQSMNNSYFLFSKTDARILNGPKRFCSNKSYDTIHREWEEIKDELQDEYKYKHRNAVRIKKKQGHQKKE